MKQFLPSITVITTLFSLLVSAEPSPPYAVNLSVDLLGSPIDNEPINANGGKFWIGKPTSQYCPPNVEQAGDCPLGNDTSVWVNNDSATSSLNVVVPGGQQIYIAPDSSLSFTQPHSAYIPPGSIVVGFTVQGNQLLFPTRSFVACLSYDSVWQIFVPLKISQIALSGPCVQIKVSTSPAKYPVWEYN
ncbi:hypothetical protein E4U55_006308 [Claviceps digitariae]|nr:hypothetical protein E4U55_006308 [Claviceps digitariae]